jgi:uncharacterized membrane protein YoaK (UPF0700 family)
MKETRSDPSRRSAGGSGVAPPQAAAALSDLWLPICLALVAGYVDAYALLSYGVYVSFMSGNTTQTGAMIGQGKLFTAVDTAVAILFFVGGVLLGTWLTNSTLRQSRQILLRVTAAMLAVVIAGTQLSNPPSHVAESIATLALAMGLMNTTYSHIGAEPVSLTFVTGTLNKIGRHLALAVRRAPLPDAKGLWDTHLRRAGIEASMWGGFLSGAVISGAASTFLGVWALVAPCVMLLALAHRPAE